MTRPIAPLLLLIATFVLLNACDSQPPASNEAPRTTDPAVKSAGPAARGTGDACDEEIAASPVRSHLNRIEDAATPEPFACFRLHAPVSAQGNQAKPGLPAPGSTQDNQAKLGIELGEESDGIDPATERVLVSLDGELLALPTGSFEPKDRNQWVYRADGPRGSGPILRIEIRGPDPKGMIELTLHVWRPSQLGGRLLVRIGDDWGAVDLDTGKRVGGGPELDTGTATSASVGPEGGTVSASGWTLTVPAGALDAATEITLTPFADGTGVRLAPHGLRFDHPATLEGGDGTPALRPSPLSALPLYEGPDGGAVLWHFSLVQTTGLAAVPDLTDFPVWAEAALDDLGEMTVSEAQQLIALAAQQQATGCEEDCIDLAALADAMTEAIAALAESACQDDVDDPTDAAVTRWLRLAADVESLGGDGQPAIDCAIDIFGALVAEARETAVAYPSDANIERLVYLWGEAQALGAHEDTVIDALKAALRSILENGTVLCDAGETDAGTGELERGLEWIDRLGHLFEGSELEADFEDALDACGCTPVVEERVTVETQEELDALWCVTEIYRLRVVDLGPPDEAKITNLDALSNLRRVTSTLRILTTGIHSLEPLANLERVEGSLKIALPAPDLTGLGNLEYVQTLIVLDPRASSGIESLDGLASEFRIGRWLSIANANSLHDISALEGAFPSEMFRLHLINSPRLDTGDLSVFRDVEVINSLRIERMDLDNLTGFGGIRRIIDRLHIKDNRLGGLDGLHDFNWEGSRSGFQITDNTGFSDEDVWDWIEEEMTCIASTGDVIRCHPFNLIVDGNQR